LGQVYLTVVNTLNAECLIEVPECVVGDLVLDGQLEEEGWDLILDPIRLVDIKVTCK